MELREGLRDKSKINYWADKYDVGYDTRIENLVPEVKKRGYLTKCELIEVSKWKVKKKRNTFRNVIKNYPDDVKKKTCAAFRANVDDSMYHLCNQRRRGMGLRGVRIPMGSAILHWFHTDCYPIWDRYAIWSVQLDESRYRNKFERWKAYTLFCREIAEEYEVCMRHLDRALMQYGKAKKPRNC